MIVLQRVGVTIEPVGYDNLLSIDIDLLHLAAEKIHVTNHFANRINDIRQIQIARGDLMQHRREQEKILAIHYRHLKARVAPLFKFERGVEPAKAAAENQNPYFRCHLVCHIHMSIARGNPYRRCVDWSAKQSEGCILVGVEQRDLWINSNENDRLVKVRIRSGDGATNAGERRAVIKLDAAVLIFDSEPFP